LERPRVEDRAGDDVGPDLGALLDDAYGARLAPLGGEHGEPARGGEPRGACAGDDDVEGHRLARLGGRRVRGKLRLRHGSKKENSCCRGRAPLRSSRTAARVPSFGTRRCNIAPAYRASRATESDVTTTDRTEPIWRPSEARAAATQMRAFLERHRHRLDRDDYAALHRWSVTELEAFWQAVSDFAGIRYATEARHVLSDRDAMPGARWFEGATLSFADNLLRPEHDALALIAVDETGRRRTMSRDELRAAAAALAKAFAQLGVGPGDRVAALMPNTAETVVAMLAATSLGATFTTCSPDFGVRGVLDRFGQTAPKVLVATDGYFYAGKRIDVLKKLREIVPQLPG